MVDLTPAQSAWFKECRANRSLGLDEALKAARKGRDSLKDNPVLASLLTDNFIPKSEDGLTSEDITTIQDQFAIKFVSSGEFDIYQLVADRLRDKLITPKNNLVPQAVLDEHPQDSIEQSFRAMTYHFLNSKKSIGIEEMKFLAAITSLHFKGNEQAYKDALPTLQQIFIKSLREVGKDIDTSSNKALEKFASGVADLIKKDSPDGARLFGNLLTGLKEESMGQAIGPNSVLYDNGNLQVITDENGNLGIIKSSSSTPTRNPMGSETPSNSSTTSTTGSSALKAELHSLTSGKVDPHIRGDVLRALHQRQIEARERDLITNVFDTLCDLAETDLAKGNFELKKSIHELSSYFFRNTENFTPSYLLHKDKKWGFRSDIDANKLALSAITLGKSFNAPDAQITNPEFYRLSNMLISYAMQLYACQLTKPNFDRVEDDTINHSENLVRLSNVPEDQHQLVIGVLFSLLKETEKQVIDTYMSKGVGQYEIIPSTTALALNGIRKNVVLSGPKNIRGEYLLLISMLIKELREGKDLKLKRLEEKIKNEGNSEVAKKLKKEKSVLEEQLHYANVLERLAYYLDDWEKFGISNLTLANINEQRSTQLARVNIKIPNTLNGEALRFVEEVVFGIDKPKPPQPTVQATTTPASTSQATPATQNPNSFISLLGSIIRAVSSPPAPTTAAAPAVATPTPAATTTTVDKPTTTPATTTTTRVLQVSNRTYYYDTNTALIYVDSAFNILDKYFKGCNINHPEQKPEIKEAFELYEKKIKPPFKELKKKVDSQGIKYVPNKKELDECIRLIDLVSSIKITYSEPVAGASRLDVVVDLPNLLTNAKSCLEKVLDLKTGKYDK